MRFLYLYICHFFMVQIILPNEYIYPVGAIDDGRTILLIHQKNPTHIELWFWDPITKQIEQGLWSLFNPAGLKLIPDLSGFSFVDKGRLHIKYFNKRSPKSIDLYEPLHNINLIYWINSFSCYTSALCNEYFSIYQINLDGTIDCLETHNKKDCLYPQKIDTNLFYIERSKKNIDGIPTNNYRIIKSEYNDPHNNSGNVIIDFLSSPVIFLTMISDTEGFVIEHPQIINSRDKVIQFHYYRIVNDNDVWLKEQIFSFAIPSSLLLDESSEQLYESILPLLPKIIDTTIYYVDCANNNNNNLEVYCYNISTKIVSKIYIPENDDQHFFVPFFVGDRMFVGGTMTDKSNQLRFDERVGICVDLFNILT